MFKTQLSAYLGRDELASWQHMLLGGLSGGIGPCVNNPLDVVKTRLQKQVRLFLCICVLRSSFGATLSPTTLEHEQQVHACLVGIGKERR